MKTTRLSAASLVAALMLTACSDAEEAGSSATSDAASTSAASSEGSVATGAPAGGDPATGEDVAVTSAADDAAATSAPGDEASATTMVPADDPAQAGSVTLDEATAAATEALTAAEMAKSKDGKKADKLFTKAFAGDALVAARAADRLEKVAGEPKAADLVANPIEPNVLAISRDAGRKPHLVLVQTVPANGMPELHLLESRSGKVKDFRIVWSAAMLPGTSLPTFDSRSSGTPVLPRNSSGDLKASPYAALKDLAEYVNYPRVGELPDLGTRGYAPAVRKAAEAQAQAVSGQATLRETNRLNRDATRTLLFPDGSGLVLGVLDRTTRFSVKSGSVLTPPELFRVFKDDAELTKRAELHTSVFSALHVPAKDQKSSKTSLLAVREQVVDATGT